MERMYGSEQFVDHPDKLWMKIKKWNSLRPKDWPVLQKLAIWRWQTAVQADRPIRHILADESLVELARTAKLDEKQLANKRFIRPGWLKRYGKDIIEIHSSARALSKSEWPVVQRPPDYPSNVEQIAEFAYIRVLECARNHQLTPSWLISKKELLKAVNGLLKGEDSGLEGWRKALLEKELTPVLEGSLSLRVHGDRLMWVETASS